MNDIFAHTIFPEFVLILLIAGLGGLLVFFISQRLPERGAKPGRAWPWSGLLVTLLATLWFLIYQHLAVQQHLALRTRGFDLGIFDQIMWNTAHGRLFANSVMSFAPMALGNHLSPTLLFFVPLYWVWSDPRALLIAQTALLTAGVAPIYLYATRRLGRTGGVVLAACYFLYPALGFVNLFEFHEVALAVPLLAFALYFMLERRYRPFIAFLILLLLTKEEMSFVTFALGLYLILVQRQRRLGLIIAGGSVAYAAAAILWLMPALQARASTVHLNRYSYLGASVGEVVGTIVTRPWVVLRQVFTLDKLGFVLRLIVPLALLPLVGWRIGLITLPSFAYLLLSDDPNTVAIIFQYSATLIPPLFFATVEGVQRLSRRSMAVKSGVLAALLLASLASYYLHGNGPLSRNYQPWHYESAGYPQRVRELLTMIPSDAPVSAQNNLVPHLSQRERVYLFPRLEDATFIALDATGDRYPLAEGSSSRKYDQAVTAVLADPHWRPLIAHEALLLLQKGEFTVPNPVEFKLGDEIELAGYDLEQGSDQLRLTLYWHATRALAQDYTVFTHLIRPGDTPLRIWAQRDNQPVHDSLPTSAWAPGRLVRDEYEIALPPDIVPGEYVLIVGMYVAPDGPRLPVQDGKGISLGDHVPLATVRISP